MNKVRDRALSAATALFLQAFFVALVIYSVPVFSPPKKLTRELILILPRLMPIPAKQEPKRANKLLPRTIAPAAIIPPIFAAPASPFYLQGFGKELFGCAAENIGKLSEEDRAKCALPHEYANIPPDSDLMGSPSHVKDEAYWTAELAREKSPPWLPCTTTIKTQVGTANGFNMGCLASKFADGSITDPHAWPIYETEQLAPNELYKIDQAYDAWNKDHVPKR